MAVFAEVGGVIENNLDRFKKPGVISVRPGYRLENGWPTGTPVIVVNVAQKRGDAPKHDLPPELGGFAVEVREASPIERLKSTRPAIYEQLKGRARPELRAPDFPHEQIIAGGPALVAAPGVDLAAQPQKPEIPYVPAAPALDAVERDFTLICHASPDAGWPTLNAFFQDIGQKLTVGLYDFTSAHILAALKTSLEKGGVKPLSLVLDHPTKNPTADQTDEDTHNQLAAALGNALSFDWAPVRGSPEVSKWVFPSAYHIKVAVRDSNTLWLSSGNWNNSNQPEDAPVLGGPDANDVFKKSDRDWHVILSDSGLAQLFEAYIQNDRQTAAGVQGHAAIVPELEVLAEHAVDLADPHPVAMMAPRAPKAFFQPEHITDHMRIQPLLTPDLAPGEQRGLYVKKMLDLIQSATQSIYIQLQYIHPSDKQEDRDFIALLDAVSQKIKDGKEVKIILSQWQNTQWLERLRGAGVDTSVVRIQNGVHNKGFVVDHKVMAVGSQNWSGDGTLRNRDATLIVENEKVAQYFEKIFLHDWNNLAVGQQH